jgi:hypothetical protein
MKPLKNPPSVRLPKGFIDEIAARCERAGRTKSRELRGALVGSLFCSGVSKLCPRRVQRAISIAFDGWFLGIEE